MSNLTFRPRPIDINKALPIIRKELDGTEVDFPLEGVGVRRSMPLMPTGMEKEDEEEAHIQEAIKQSLKLKPEKIDIPTPVVLVVEGYDDELDPHPFHRTNTYLHYIDKTRDEEDAIVEYDMDPEDMDFLERLNEEYAKRGVKPLSEDRFEQTIDRLEKEAGRLDGVIPHFSDMERTFASIKSGMLQAIYDYWIERRKQERTPLNHRFLKPPDPEDPDPYRAFRPREEEKLKKKGRKNDQFSLIKMRQLRHEMERARTLLEMIKKREKLKLDYVTSIEEVFEAQLANPRSERVGLDSPTPSPPIVPPPPITKAEPISPIIAPKSRNTANSHATRAREPIEQPKKRQKKTNVPKTRRQIQSSPESIEMSYDNDDDLFQDELSSDHEEIFYEPEKEEEESETEEEVSDWPPAENIYADAVIDIFAQRANNASMINLGGRIPSFRGRCRIGRGGRIIFDRRPPTSSNGIVRSFETDEECPTRIASLISLYASGQHPLSAGRASDADKLLRQYERIEANKKRNEKHHNGRRGAESSMDVT